MAPKATNNVYPKTFYGLFKKLGPKQHQLIFSDEMVGYSAEKIETEGMIPALTPNELFSQQTFKH